MFIRTIYDTVLDCFLYFIHGFFIRWPVKAFRTVAGLWYWVSYYCGALFFERIGHKIESGIGYCVEEMPRDIQYWIQSMFFPIKFEEFEEHRFNNDTSKWLDENIGRYRWKILTKNYFRCLYFRHTDDAMAFKLWWT